MTKHRAMFTIFALILVVLDFKLKAELDTGRYCRLSSSKQLLPDPKYQLLQHEVCLLFLISPLSVISYFAQVDFTSPTHLLKIYHEMDKIEISPHPTDHDVVIAGSLDAALLFGEGYPLSMQSLKSDILMSETDFYYQACR